MSRHGRGAPRQFSKSDRVSTLVRNIVADELERIGDDRLDLVTITSVRVDPDLARAKVYYSALTVTEAGRGGEVADALAEHRRKIQQVINRQVRTRKVPQIEFFEDDVLTQALHIEDVLRGLNGDGGTGDAGEADPTTAPSPSGDSD